MVLLSSSPAPLAPNTRPGVLPCPWNNKPVEAGVPKLKVPPVQLIVPVWFQSIGVPVFGCTILIVPPDMLKKFFGSVEGKPKEGEAMQPPAVQTLTVPPDCV